LLSNTGVLDHVYATARSNDLIINASSPATGGDITIGSAFTGGPTAGMANGTLPINDLTIDSTGGTAIGVIQLGRSIQLTSGGQLTVGGPILAPVLTIAGAVQLTDHVTMNVSDALTSGGRVDLRRAAVSSLGATAFNLILDTRYTGLEPDKSGGDVLTTGNVKLTTTTTDAMLNGGAIDFSQATLGADQSGRSLILDSRYIGSNLSRAGGAITLGSVQNFRGAFGADVQNVSIRTTSDAGGSPGAVTFNGVVGLLGDLDVGGGPIAINTAGIITVGDQTYDFPVTLGTGTTLVAQNILFASTVDNGGHELRLDVTGNTGIAQQPISGAGGLSKLGSGNFTLAAANTYTGTTSIVAGRLNINGSVASNSVGIAGGTLGGTGMVTGPVGMGPAGGGVSPGTSPGTLTVDNNVTFFSGTSFDVELGVSQHDHLKVTGATSQVRLADATLSISPIAGNIPQVGQSLMIIDNASPAAIAGTFLNLAEGATVTVGSFNAAISYRGGDGNDAVLTVLPPTLVNPVVIPPGQTAPSAPSGGTNLSGGGIVSNTPTPRLTSLIDILPLTEVGYVPHGAGTAGFIVRFFATSMATNPGNVQAQLLRGKLVVTGDAGDNGVRIEPGAGRDSLRVTGLDGTTINGQSESREFVGARNGIDANLGDGDDKLFIGQGAARLVQRGTVRLNTSLGNDLVRIENATLSGPLLVDMGADDDTVELVDSLLAGAVLLDASGGDDSITLKDSEFRRGVRVTAGSGVDSLTIRRSQFARSFVHDLDSNDIPITLIDTVLAAGSRVQRRASRQ